MTIAPPSSAPETKVASPRLPRGELLGLFIGSRVLIYVVAWLSLLGVRKPDGFLPPATFPDWFLRWDALWHWDVAARGYHFTDAPEKTNVVFLPLYGWIVRAVSLDGWLDMRVVGTLVSFAALWGATVLLWRLVARESGDSRLATLTVTFLLFGPVSFFFSGLFSEAVFLPLAIGSIAAARRDRWWLAGCLGALAAFARFVGLVLIVPLLWEALVQARSTRPNGLPPWRRIVAGLLPLVGFAAFCGILAVKFGDPLLYFHAEEQLWSRHFTWFWTLFAQPSFLHLAPFYRVWFAATVVVALGLIAAGAVLRMPSTYLVFALAFAAVYLSAHGVESLPRYFSVVFPLYLTAAMLVRRWPALGTPLIAGSTALLTLSVILFVNGYWFT